MDKRTRTLHGAEAAQSSKRHKEKEYSRHDASEEFGGDVEVGVGVVDRILSSLRLVVYAALCGRACARAAQQTGVRTISPWRYRRLRVL